jgi:predicted dehydrogenase
MKAGLDVYCEKEMSNTLEGARKMILTERETGKLLQIGHQRRSNPRYRFAYDKVITEGKMLGRMTTINGQWNRSRNACQDITCSKKLFIDEPTLKKYGFKSMEQFLNWRWYKGLGGGPIVDLGSHQIDIYAWFCGCNPKAVMATGGVDYWKNHEWYDNVIALFEFETKEGMVRASYQTTTTNSSGGYYETFMGDQATLTISEDASQVGLYREDKYPEDNWYKWEDKRYIKRAQGLVQASNKKSVIDPRATNPPPKYDMFVEMNKKLHQPHLENFFGAMRGEEKLTCPGKIGYETAVAVLKVNEAVKTGRKIEFKPEEFHVA